MANTDPPKKRPRGDDDTFRPKRWRGRKERRREDLMAAWSGDFAELDNEARQEPPQPLGEVVQHLMGKLEQDDRRVLRELVDSWAEIVGRDLAAATSPQRIDRQTLYIEVTNSSMRYKLNLKQRDLSRKLHDFTGGEVNRIRLVSGGRSATR